MISPAVPPYSSITMANGASALRNRGRRSDAEAVSGTASTVVIASSMLNSGSVPFFEPLALARSAGSSRLTSITPTTWSMSPS